jgi:hypothetical protein
MVSTYACDELSERHNSRMLKKTVQQGRANEGPRRTL